MKEESNTNLEKKIKLLEREVELLEQINELYSLIEKQKEKQTYEPIPIPVVHPIYPPIYPLVTYTTNETKLKVEDKNDLEIRSM